ncbi:MAG: hypothetical protein ACYDEO_24075 [Aggregatilineales bacterium]
MWQPHSQGASEKFNKSEQAVSIQVEGPGTNMFLMDLPNYSTPGTYPMLPFSKAVAGSSVLSMTASCGVPGHLVYDFWDARQGTLTLTSTGDALIGSFEFTADTDFGLISKVIEVKGSFRLFSQLK